MSNIKLSKTSKPSSFRVMAIGSWKKAHDPKIYTKIKIDITNIEKILKKSTTPLTTTHFFASAFGKMFKQYPYLNQVLIRNKLYQREEINVFIHTHLNTKKGYDLNGITIQNVNLLSVTEIANYVNKETNKLRKNKNKSINKSKKLLAIFPSWSYQFAMKLIEFLLYPLNRNLSSIGIPKDPFGSFALSAIGSFGFHEAFLPLFPLARMPLVIGIGKPYDQLVLKNNKPINQKMINLCFTADHRYVDGAHLAKPLRFLKKIIQDPLNNGIKI